MPRIFQMPIDPQLQAWIDFVSRQQAERFRAEQERAEEREAQKQRLILGSTIAATAIIGGVGGAIAGGASTAGATTGAAAGLTSQAAGAAIGGPAGAALGGAGAAQAAVAASAGAAAAGAGGGALAGGLAGALRGAMIGTKIGGQFAQGDYAGGATTAAQAVGGLMQAMEDQQFYGGAISSKERASVQSAALKVGGTMAQFEQLSQQTGAFIPELIQNARIDQESDQVYQERLNELGFFGTAQEADALAVEGGFQSRSGLVRALQAQEDQRQVQVAGQKSYEQTMGKAEALAASAARNEEMELRPDPRAVALFKDKLNNIQAALANNEITPEQADQQTASVPVPQASWRPRKTPRTLEEDEEISNKTGQIYIRDARSPNGRRHVGSMKQAGDDVAAAIMKHQEAMSKAAFRPVSMAEAAADYVEARRIAEQLEAGTFQQPAAPQQPAVQPPQPRLPGTPVPGPAGAAGVVGFTEPAEAQQQVQNASQVLAIAIKAFPDIEKWPSELREQMIPPATLLNKMFIERLQRGETLSPDEVALARLVKKIIQEG